MCRNLLSSLSSTICVCWPPPAPSLLFPSLSPPFSPATQSAPPPSLSLSLSGTQAARSFNRLGNGFISSNAVWSEAEPLTLSKRLPTAVMCFHTSQSTRPHRLTIFPHRRPPSLSLSLALYLFISLTLLPLTLKQTPPFRFPPPFLPPPPFLLYSLHLPEAFCFILVTRHLATDSSLLFCPFTSLLTSSSTISQSPSFPLALIRSFCSSFSTCLSLSLFGSSDLLGSLLEQKVGVAHLWADGRGEGTCTDRPPPPQTPLN